MNIKLRIGELILFEQLTGTTWSRAKATFTTKPCKLHRLSLQGSSEKPQLEQLELAMEISGCRDCELPDPPVRIKAAVAFLVERRGDPSLTWDGFLAEDEFALETSLGKAMAAVAAEAASATDSEPSTEPGSGRSSTSTRVSRRKATRS